MQQACHLAGEVHAVSPCKANRPTRTILQLSAKIAHTAARSDPLAEAMNAERARLLLRAALVTVVLAVLAHTQADPDLWGHIRFGRDIIESRAIPSLDPYSFTSDRAWVNHEWLAECVMYLAYAAGGHHKLRLTDDLTTACRTSRPSNPPRGTVPPTPGGAAAVGIGLTV